MKIRVLQYACASSNARWRSGRYGPARHTSAISMQSGSSSTMTDTVVAATATHRPPKTEHMPSVIPAFTAAKALGLAQMVKGQGRKQPELTRGR
jgi:hypothetical protein